MNTKEVRIVSESIKGEWRARERTIAKDICSNCSGLTENLRYGKANRSGDAATEKIACDLEFPRARTLHSTGSQAVRQEWTRALLWFLWEETGKAGHAG